MFGNLPHQDEEKRRNEGETPLMRRSGEFQGLIFDWLYLDIARVKYLSNNIRH